MHPAMPLLALTCASAMSSLAALTVDKDEILFTSRQGQGDRIVPVTLINDSDELFTITEIITGCCTKYDLTTTTLMPHDRTELFLILNVTVFSTDEVKKVVVVGKGSSGRIQRVPFMLKHTIKPLLVMNPQELQWIQGGDANALEVSMTVAPDQALAIRSIEAPANSSNLSLTSTIAPTGRRATATVALVDPAKPTTEFINVYLEGRDRRPVVLPIRCTNEMQGIGKTAP